MAENWIEADCTFEHGGQTFEASGASITADQVIGYVRGLENGLTRVGNAHANGEIVNWHGDTVLGQIWRAKSWRVRSYIGSRMYQITANINGVWYTGRSYGDGMAWRGKRCANQSTH